MSNSFWPHELQGTRLPCPSLSPGVCSNSHTLNWWCHLTMSSFAASFSCPQSFPESGSCPISWLFASGGQSIRASASTSVLSMNIQGWFPLWLSVLISSYWWTLVNRLFNSLFYLYYTWPYILFFESRKVWLYSQHRNGSNTSYGQCTFFFLIFILYWSIVFD